MQQHVARRKLWEGCSWDGSATAVLSRAAYRLGRSRAINGMISRRQDAKSKCDCEQQARVGASLVK